MPINLSRLAVIAKVTMLCALAGCTTPAPVRYIPTSEPFCASVQTVCINKDDQITEATSEQIEANNRGRQQLVKAKQCRPRPEDECKKKPTS